MNSKILLAIVVLIVAFGAFTFLGNKKVGTPSPAQKTESIDNTIPSQAEQQLEVVIVALTDTGFVPKNVSIKVGQKVIWLNKSGKTATVSSDDHPTHQLYPFLNLGEFVNGSNLQIVFDKIGKFEYHDHYNTTSTGTVIVE